MGKDAKDIADRVADVLSRREAAATRAGRHPLEVRLVAATKSVPFGRIIAGVRAGLRVFGESYVQEAIEKIARVKKELGDDADDLSWHFIGKMQRNKVRLAISPFDLIHSVDSVPLAQEIDRRAGSRGFTQHVLMEVNVEGEPNKAGFRPEDAVGAAQAIDKLENIRLGGLMCIPPFSEDPEASRPHFQAVRTLLDEIRRRGLANESFRELSMGMTTDFEVAIEEGATWIRVGTAIFGPRPR